MASGSFVSALALNAAPRTSENAKTVRPMNGISILQLCGRSMSRHCEERNDEAIQRLLISHLDCFASLAMTSGHRLGEIVRNLVEEACGREPALVGADEQREILGHEAGLD